MKWLVCIKGIRDVPEVRGAVEKLGKGIAKEKGISVLNTTTMGTFNAFYFELECEKQKAGEFAKELLDACEKAQLTRTLAEREYIVYPIS